MIGGNYSSFILRLWVEPGGGWRWGIIQHVATRKKRRFSNASEMLDFISEYSTQAEVSIPFLLDGSEVASEADDDPNDDADLIGEADQPKAAKNGGPDDAAHGPGSGNGKPPC